MKLVAVMPVRNEAWVLGLSARVALMWCDALVVLDHASTDETANILAGLAAEFFPVDRLTIITEPVPEWREMEHRQWLLRHARISGATHIAIVDADEVLCGDSLPNIRRWSESLMAGECLNVRMRSMWRSIDRYRVDPCVWSDRRDLSLVFRDSPALCWQANEGYQHHSRAPRGSTRLFTSTGRFPRQDDLGVMHLQWASWRRVVAKHALYKVRERIDYPAKPTSEIEHMYSQALNESGLKCNPAPAAWWQPYQHLLKYLDLDAVPWQEAEARRLVAEHGREKFAGLDLFGIA